MPHIMFVQCLSASLMFPDPVCSAIRNNYAERESTRYDPFSKAGIEFRERLNYDFSYAVC